MACVPGGNAFLPSPRNSGWRSRGYEPLATSRLRGYALIATTGRAMDPLSRPNGTSLSGGTGRRSGGSFFWTSMRPYKPLGWGSSCPEWVRVGSEVEQPTEAPDGLHAAAP